MLRLYSFISISQPLFLYFESQTSIFGPSEPLIPSKFEFFGGNGSSSLTSPLSLRLSFLNFSPMCKIFLYHQCSISPPIQFSNICFNLLKQRQTHQMKSYPSSENSRPESLRNSDTPKFNTFKKTGWIVYKIRSFG